MIITFCGHKNIVDRCSVQEKLTNSILLLFASAQNGHTPLFFIVADTGNLITFQKKPLKKHEKDFPT